MSANDRHNVGFCFALRAHFRHRREMRNMPYFEMVGHMYYHLIGEVSYTAMMIGILTAGNATHRYFFSYSLSPEFHDGRNSIINEISIASDE